MTFECNVMRVFAAEEVNLRHLAAENQRHLILERYAGEGGYGPDVVADLRDAPSFSFD